ncbi:hypothetical protein ACROYT_G008562, partial [Oculina patagonica]
AEGQTTRMGIFVSTEPVDEEDEQEVEAFRKPKYYRGRDGPKFRVMNFTKDYEYRRYESSTWISARLENMEHSKALSKGEKILGRYFNGKNGPEKFIELTCPLKVRIELGKEGGWDEKGEFIASLHLPYENANRPPAPSESGLFIQDMAEHFAYVSSFEGFANEKKWQEEVFKLKRILDGEGKKYDKQVVFTAKYENLLHFGKKRNEVIFVVAND